MRSLIFTISLCTLFTVSSLIHTSFAQTQQYNISSFDRNEFSKLNQTKQSQYNPWTIHRKISVYGLAGSIAATFIGALAMDDETFATTVIPIAGPFITTTRIENDASLYYQPGGKQLLTASGIIQSAFAVYFVTSLIGESNYKGKYLSSNVFVSPIPTSKGVGVSMNVQF